MSKHAIDTKGILLGETPNLSDFYRTLTNPTGLEDTVSLVKVNKHVYSKMIDDETRPVVTITVPPFGEFMLNRYIANA